MKKQLINPLLTIGSLLCLVCAVTGRPESVFNRAERILQATGTANTNVAFTVGPEINEQCDSQGVSSKDLDINEEQRKVLRAEISGRFSGVFNSFVTDTASGKDLGATAGDNASKLVTGSSILFTSIIFVLAVLSFFFMFLWSLTECCCKKTCCLEPQKKGEPRGKLQICIWVFTLIIAAATLILLIVWLSYLGSSINTFQDTKCGVAILYSNLLNGANLEKGKIFMGITPLQKTLTDFQTSLGSIKDVKNQAQAIVNQNLPTKATTNMNVFTTYSNSVSATVSTYTGIDGGANSVASVFLAALPEIVKQALSAENKALKDICDQIDAGCKTIASLDTAQIDSIKETVGKLSTTIDTTVTQNVKSVYTTLTSGSTSDAAKTVGRTAFVVSLVLVVSFTILFVAVLYLTAYKDTCHWLKIVPKIIMIIFMLLVIFIMVACILFTTIVIVVYFVCFITDSLQSNKDSFKTNFQGLIKDTKINDLSNTCIFVDGSGDLLGALGFSGGDTTKFTGMLDSATTIKTLLSNLSNSVNPPVISAIDANFTDFTAFKSLDQGVPEAKSLKNGYTTFNSYKCVSGKEQMQYRAEDCGTGVPTSVTTDSSTTPAKSGSYCIIFKTYPNYLPGPATRYTSTDCTEWSKANSLLSSVSVSITSYLNALNAAKSPNYVAARDSENNLYATLRSSSNDMKAILDNLQAAADSVSKVGSSLNTAINCLILNKGIRIFENVLCYRSAGKLYTQSGVGAAFGFLLFIYSWCICCSLRCASKQEESENGQQDTKTLGVHQDTHQPASEYAQNPHQPGNEYHQNPHQPEYEMMPVPPGEQPHQGYN
jgi:hypothetical protein